MSRFLELLIIPFPHEETVASQHCDQLSGFIPICDITGNELRILSVYQSSNLIAFGATNVSFGSGLCKNSKYFRRNGTSLHEPRTRSIMLIACPTFISNSPAAPPSFPPIFLNEDFYTARGSRRHNNVFHSFDRLPAVSNPITNTNASHSENPSAEGF